MDNVVNRAPSRSSARASEVAIVIVTRDRPLFLNALLQSILNLTTLPGFVIVVDNDSGEETRAVIDSYVSSCPRQIQIVNRRQRKNTGGAGGFNTGLSAAMDAGADWFWLMDDDVEVLPDGLDLLLGWTDRFRCFHGQRYDSDGRPFVLSQRISERLAIQVPILPDPLRKNDHLLTNWACFEGLFIHRSIVQKIGLPDPRFFIVWDDAMYGFRASRITDVAFVNSFVLKRARSQPQISLGIRHLNGASDLTRFYMMRNRALIELHLKHYDSFHPFWFGIGTMLVLAKELFRLVIVERSIRGIGALHRGMKAAKELRGMTGLALMPPIDVQPNFASRAAEATG
jgi:rhamnopyranosyl-N-acetylglucosaminyl-diphospho-decaprenol beta-1,3/1,4-galactofuranosyltransferase